MIKFKSIVFKANGKILLEVRDTTFPAAVDEAREKGINYLDLKTTVEFNYERAPLLVDKCLNCATV